MKTEPRSQPLYIPSSLEQCLVAPPLSVRGVRAKAGNALARLVKTMQTFSRRWVYRYRLRRSLQEMDSALVEKDIGVSRGSLTEEAYKPFWRE